MIKINPKEPDQPKPDEKLPTAQPEAAADDTPQKKLADEAEEFCADLEKFFRRALGEMPTAVDLAELRAQQAGARELARRADQLAGEAEDKFAAVSAERDNLKDAATRSRADFLNYQARATKDLQRAEELALRGYVMDLLPVLDSVDLAVRDAASGAADLKRLKDAIGLIYNSLNQVLAVRGLQRIVVACGQPLDPNEHEAVAQRPSDSAKGEKPGTVLEVLRPGYLWKGLLLRPAQVLVAEPDKSAKKASEAAQPG